MLPAEARLRRSEDFARAVRRGRRAGRQTLVVHVHPGDAGGDQVTGATTGAPVSATRAGFVVSRAVGGAVVRNRVRRRLRHLMRDRLDRLPRGSVVVVRALPASAAASSRVLAGDLDSALARLTAGGRDGAARQRPAGEAGGPP